MSAARHWSGDLTDNPAVLKGLIGDAWEAMPDDMTGAHDTLASAVAALVQQRDQARKSMADARPDPLMAVWVELEGHYPDEWATTAGIARAVADLVKQVRQLKAEQADNRALIEAAADGVSAALHQVAEQMEYVVGWPYRDRWSYLAGWLDGRRESNR